MRRELLYAKNQGHTKRFWFIVYSVILLAILVALYIIGNQIKTRVLPVGNIDFKIPYSRYLVGETISFSIKNNYNSSVYIRNECPSEPLDVYRKEGTKWVRIHDTASSKDCSIENRLVEIPANSTVSGNYAPWHNLFKKPGKYRVVAYVEYYNSLPYQDFEVINPPKIPAPRKITIPSSSSTTSPAPENTGGGETNEGGDSINERSSQVYTVTINSNGFYSTPNGTSALTINSGDIINFIYSPCCGNEVRTIFTPVAPTTYQISPITLDHDITSYSRAFIAKGKWRLKVADHNGNTLLLTVN